MGVLVCAVWHDRVRRAEQSGSVTRQADWLASAGADLLVLAAATGGTGYSVSGDISDDEWRVLFESLDLVADVADRRSLRTGRHPHFGTVIERRHHVMRFLYEARL